MIISRTPLRISFTGGGSDISSYYKHNTGAVISTAIDKYIYITINEKFDHKIRVSYSKTEIVDSVDEIKHELVRECLKKTGIKGGIEITSISDIPSEGTGLGSSSSYVVGLLNALYAYKGIYATAERLAREACEIEIDTLKKPIGKQDQYMAAYGGLQFMQFYSEGTVSVDPIICSPELKAKLESKFILLYTGITRSSSDILGVQSKNLTSDIKKREIMSEMVNLAYRMRSDLNNNSLKRFGGLMHENWLLKQTLAKGISSEEINKWYSTALKLGAEGGKILGAGGGGFLLIYSSKKYHDKIVKSLRNLEYKSFRFEPQGSKIIFVS